MRYSTLLFVVLSVTSLALAADDPPRVAAPHKDNFVTDPNVFPIAVWLQNSSRAAEYKAIGINLYVALWRGPTDEQLAELKRHGLRVICSQNAAGLNHIDDSTIV